MYMLAILCVFVITCLIPAAAVLIGRHFPKIKMYPAPAWLPTIAAILLVAAFYIPNIHISNQTTTFQQHFVGGGMYVACLLVYFKKLLGWRLHWFAMLLVLFAWASAFGVANELMEFTLTQFGFAHIATGDTDWDLLANTLGAFVGYGLLLLTKIARLP